MYGWIYLPFLLCVILPLVESFTCSTNTRCNCSIREGEIYADCGGLKLTHSPFFNNNVTKIDLENNNLIQVPSILPANITFLKLNFNDLTYLINGSLSRYKSLRYLDLSRNHLTVIEMGSFAFQQNIEFVDISNNVDLSIVALRNITYDLQTSKLKSLSVDKIECLFGPTITLQKRHAEFLTNTSIEYLSIASNRIGMIERGLIKKLPKTIRYIDASNNDFSVGWYLVELFHLQNLEILDLSSKSKFEKGFFVDNLLCMNILADCTIDASAPRITKQSAHYKVTIPLPPNLEILSLDGRKIDSDEFFNKDYNVAVSTRNNLKELSLKNNLLTELKDNVVFDNLKKLDLSQNFCSNISEAFFDTKEQLTSLNLSNNLLANILSTSAKCQIFRNLRNLRVLDLSTNGIFRLHRQTFQNLEQIAYLNLSHNALQTWNIDLKHMKNLVLLDLSYNQIRSLDKNSLTKFKSLRLNHELKLNLLGNPLECMCDNLDFFKWIQKTKNVEFVKRSEYLCINSNGTWNSFIDFLKMINELNIECASYTTVIIVSTSLIFISISIVISLIVYRYRWKLRYLYFAAKRHYKGYKILPNDQNYRRHRFDAFISYANEDRHLIVENIIHLEKENNIKCCLHFRDFMPGVDVTENIFNAINNSKRTICFLSKSFFKSPWCEYELNIAHMEHINCKSEENVLILVAMENNIVLEVPRRIMNMVNDISFIEYWDIVQAIERFWRQLCFVKDRNYDSSQYDYDIFISCSEKDKHLIIPNMYRVQEKQSNITWFSFHNNDILKSRKACTNLSNSVHKSEKAICFLSHSYFESDACLDELNTAFVECESRRQNNAFLTLVNLEKSAVSRLQEEKLQLTESVIDFYNTVDNVTEIWRQLGDALC